LWYISYTMKGKLLVFLFLLLAFGGFIAFKFFVLDKRSVGGKLKVLASPVSSVFLDNKTIGKTPYEGETPVGEYMLKLIPEVTGTESASWQSKIKIYPNALTYVDRELGSSDLTSAGVILTAVKMTSAPKKKDTGEVEVESEPAGAIVYLDNDEKGIAPLILSEVQVGDHELSVYVPGFFRRTQKINIDKGYRTVASFKLALDQSQKKIEEVTATEEGSLATKEASGSASTKSFSIIIQDTPTGWLRVRSEPTLNSSEEAKVNPKEEFTVLEEKDGWYKIEYKKGETGWVSAQYVEKVKK